MKQWRLQLIATCLVLSAHAAYADGDIPQMDQTWYPNQLLWLAVSFILMFILVSRVIVPSISTVLATRESAINDAIAEAERAKVEAEKTRGNASSEGQSARIKAAEIIAAAQAENSKAAAEALAKLDHELAQKVSHAAAVLEDAVIKAQSQLDGAANSLATSISAALLGAGAIAEADAPKLKLAVKR